MKFAEDELRDYELKVLFENGYTVGVEIGKGSFANVHLADYKNPNSDEYHLLACRIFDKDRAGLTKEHLENLLLNELDILSKIKNPHLIQVQGIIEIERKIFIFMRFEENGNLLEYMKIKGALKDPYAKRWFRQMACGLEYLHGKGIAHRDLKCENILISREGNLKIADFGFATYCVDESGRKLLSTMYCGSVSYAAPEVLSGTPHDPKPADVWSLGVILYIMLTAQMPFADTESMQSMIKSQVTQGWKLHLKTENIEVSEGGMKLLCQMLEADTVNRLPVKEVVAHSWMLQKPAQRYNCTNEVIPNRPTSPPQVKKSMFTNTQPI